LALYLFVIVKISCAAQILQKLVHLIAPTTNHLEAFNGILKWKYICCFQKNGRSICFDLLIYLLGTQIIPGIFQQHTAEQTYYNWLSTWFSKQAGC